MQAIWNNKVVAEASREDLIRIEGNWYFPREAVKDEFLQESGTHTTCFWKGEASYFDLVVNGETNKDAAWYYHEPMAGSIDKVTKDFTDYVAFWHGVAVTDAAMVEA